MTLAEIISLSNAGFTKDDIIKLAGVQDPAPAAPAPAAPAPAAPAPAAPAPAAPAPAAPAPAAPAPAAPAPAAQPSAELAEILAAIRGANIAGVAGPDPAQAPSTDDILATIINPFSTSENN